MSDLILSADKALVVPAADGQAPLVFDMREIFRAESRLIELNAVTRVKAGELLHTFITAWRDTKRLVARTRRQLVAAKRNVKEARATVIVDKLQEILKEKGLATPKSPSGSEDLRSSIVEKDPDYKAANAIQEEIEAALEWLEIQAETFKMAYFSVNKLIDPREAGASTSGGTGTDEPGTLTDDDRVEEFVNKVTTVDKKNYSKGFGAPKF
jgi:hypothetical protein